MLNRTTAGRAPAASRSLRACVVAAATLAAASSLSCSSGDGAESFTHSVVLARAILVAESARDPDGGPAVVEGIDIDQRVDIGNEPEGCFKADGVTPDGEGGIDNQLGAAGPIIAMFGGDVEALIQGAINEGSLLILVEFSGVESFVNDDDVDVRILFGSGPTDVGNDGILVPGQSFDIRPGAVISEIQGAQIVEGRMQAGTFDTVLPVAILDQRFDLPINGARLDILFDPENGHVEGFLGGGVPIQVLLRDLIDNIPGVDEQTSTAVELLLPPLADLRGDSGDCDEMSAAIRVSGVTAFVLPGEDE